MVSHTPIMYRTNIHNITSHIGKAQTYSGEHLCIKHDNVTLEFQSEGAINSRIAKL